MSVFADILVWAAIAIAYVYNWILQDRINYTNARVSKMRQEYAGLHRKHRDHTHPITSTELLPSNVAEVTEDAT